MGALRTRMIEEMKLRNFSPRTQESYVGAMIGNHRYRGCAAHLGSNPQGSFSSALSGARRRIVLRPKPLDSGTQKLSVSG